MIRLTALMFTAALLASPLAAESEVPETPSDGSYNTELGLPYGAPGRGEIDHEALRRRSLEVLERQFGAFDSAAAGLAEVAAAHCTGEVSEDALKAQFAATWLAWAPLDSYQFGPIQNIGAALTVNFWPDKKNFVGRGLRALLELPPEQQADPSVVAGASAAAQGLPALETLLYTDLPPCPAVVGISGYMAGLSNALYQLWFGPDGWADLARTTGPDNPVYLSAEEFTKTLYTAVDFGLVRIEEARLGRPLGTYERSFPTRAEAWRSGLTNPIIHAQLRGLEDLIALGFAGDVREPDRAWILQVFEQAHDRLDAIGVDISTAVEDPATRFRVESLQDKIAYLRSELAQTIGPELGVDTGFSAADGD
ncbi:imelysin family protein [Fluviibacterium sp. DFM31]|uniref:Imelysin family protein n=1 Tax=Meridianimarinicoccus marinus TaxID=3231483 RepID=A0ABV3L2J7_9RHOB